MSERPQWLDEMTTKMAELFESDDSGPAPIETRAWEERGAWTVEAYPAIVVNPEGSLVFARNLSLNLEYLLGLFPAKQTRWGSEGLEILGMFQGHTVKVHLYHVPPDDAKPSAQLEIRNGKEHVVPLPEGFEPKKDPSGDVLDAALQKGLEAVKTYVATCREEARGMRAERLEDIAPLNLLKLLLSANTVEAKAEGATEAMRILAEAL